MLHVPLVEGGWIYLNPNYIVTIVDITAGQCSVQMTDGSSYMIDRSGDKVAEAL